MGFFDTDREVTIEMQPVALQSNVASQIQRISQKTYGVMPSLHGVPTKRYTTPKGTKVTKLLARRLTQAGVDKKKRAEKWSVYCKEIRRLYGNDLTILAKLYDPFLLGEGVYDSSGGTCLRDGCNNQRSKDLVMLFNRSTMLTIEVVSGQWKDDKYGFNPTNWGSIRRPRGRCVIFHAGRRHILLSNFYYREGLDNNYHLYIQALEKFYNTQFTSVRKAGGKDVIPDNLFPMARNSDGVLITDAKGKERGISSEQGLGPGVKPPCAYCGKRVHWKDYWRSKAGYTTYFGCSPEHGKRSLKKQNTVTCYGCDEPITVNPRKLRSLANVKTKGRKVKLNEIITPYGKSGPYCANCWEHDHIECANCKKAIPDPGMWVVQRDEYKVCRPCASHLQSTGKECEICSEIYVRYAGMRKASKYLNVNRINELRQARRIDKLIVPHANICKKCITRLPKCGICGATSIDSVENMLGEVQNGRQSVDLMQSMGNQKTCVSCVGKRVGPTQTAASYKEFMLNDALGSLMLIDNLTKEIPMYDMASMTEPVIATLEGLRDEELENAMGGIL